MTETGRPGLTGLIVLALALLLLPPRGAWATSDACYYQLLKDASPPAKNLEACLRVQTDSFKALANGPQGARYLFRMAKLKVLLFRSTGQTAFLDEAVDDYRRLMKRYPDSSLADDAQFNLGEVYLEDRKDKVEAYVEYLKVEVRYPQGDMVPQAQARLKELGRSLEKPAPQPAAEEDRPPENKLEIKPSAKPKPPPQPAEEEPAKPSRTEKDDPPPSANGLAQVVGLRHWSAASYTRVVVDLTGPVEFEPHLLRPDPNLDKPARLYVDLKGARLGGQGEKEIDIANAHLHKARMGQYDGQTVRVVLDIQAIGGYKAFILHSPERLVIDVSGSQVGKGALAKAGSGARVGSSGEGGGAASSPPHASASVQKGRRVPRGPAGGEAGPSLAAQLGLGVKTVVIDPGHGGKDPGARTCVPGLDEKDITLAVALKLAQDLRQRLGLKVVLTRTKDVFVPLEERTAIANTSQADLFISIHVNAAESRHLQGVETYFLNLATDERAIELAARENATSTKSISDLQNILNDLMLNTKINESNRLAFQTQRQLMAAIKQKHPGAKSLGVKQAPFYVLLGAQMPAALVEIGFGTNPQECRRLASSKYLESVALGIGRGLAAYIEQNHTGG